MTRLCCTCRAGCLLIAMLANFPAIAQVANAAGGPNFTFPMAGIVNKSGLKLTIDGRGVDGTGYRPLRIEVVPVPLLPLTADRQIRIVLKPREYSTMGMPEISQVIDLPEGSTKVEATISVPQSSMWYSMSIDTYEGGEKWEELSAPYMGWQTNGYWDWTEARPSILVVDGDAPQRVDRDTAVQAYRTTGADPAPTHDLPDVRTLAWLFTDPNTRANLPMAGIVGPTGAAVNATRVTDVAMLSQISELNRVDVISPSELSSRWIDLSSVDVVCIAHDDLTALVKEHPARLEALRGWLSTGPLLVVYGVGDDFERLGEVEKVLKLPAMPKSDKAPSEYLHWQSPDIGDRRSELNTPWDEYRRLGGARVTRRPGPRFGLQTTAPVLGQALDAAEAADAGKPAPSNVAPAKPPFLTRPAGLGCVAAIASSEPFPGKDADWIWLFNSVSDHHWRWFQRNGFSLHRQNDDYWMFLIPGVGEAPVVSFLLLVSLFAVLIGPVNYILLGRAQRLYLLLITVPAGAAVVTVCLFGYALVTDGLGVRLRARSFTELDQRTGEAAVWSRQSYYAAIAPSDGLIFPDDTTVFSIVHQPSWRRVQSASSTVLEWDQELGQRLKSGYLPSRSASQFMVQRAAKTSGKLVVRERGPGEPPSAENQLETRIHYLLLRDGSGKYFAASGVAEGSSAKLATVEVAAAEKALQKLFDAVEPNLPRDYDPSIHTNSALSILSPNYGNWMGVDGSASSPVMAVSILEMNLAAVRQPTIRPLEPGTYVAVVDRSPTVPIGVPRVSEEASLHVIRGRW